ncbi:hypothetical protein SEPCBS119000_001784 [Sporothrix epigloea]|uniref:MINDY deubiquitinase domain-containing protein n=1 Tax=Sporothrix epigloea TaxID=1892477 RepID=A0ABP0DCL6_9PEZI
MVGQESVSQPDGAAITSSLDPHANEKPGQRPTSPVSPTLSDQYSNFNIEEQSAWSQSTLQDATHEVNRPPLPRKALAAATPTPTALPASANDSSNTRLLSETNPFRRKMLAPSSSCSPSAPQRPLVVDLQAPAQIMSLSQLSMDEQNQNPWQPLPEGDGTFASAPAPAILERTASEAGENGWTSQNVSTRAFENTNLAAGSSNVRFLNPNSLAPGEEADGAGWEEIVTPAATTSVPKAGGVPLQSLLRDSNEWDDVDGIAGRRPLPPGPAGSSWALAANEAVPELLSRQSSWENVADDGEDDREPGGGNGSGRDAQTATHSSAEIQNSDPLDRVEDTVPQLPPQLPPRNVPEVGNGIPPRQPARPADSDTSEIYQVKNISWYDFRTPQNPRISPILLQNANGPCPLVALVNALSLSSPPDMSTPLTEILQTRERVSLSLVLEALVEELMSTQRSNSDSNLPDLSELFNFLRGIHTGMNVNPRFIPTPDVLAAFRRTSLSHLHPAERDQMVPGTFEDTREMQLYATFKIPLIHGWLPAKGDSAYAALARQATSYEDVQNVLFREEELLDKFSSPYGDGLTEEERQLLQDIDTIKTYLHVSATQLTPFGLEVIGKAMLPGTFAILFRNDHFSTLYLHPQTSQLLSLVTDAGYANLDEVIWEALIDVNGEHADFYSGDFRPVGGDSAQQSSHGVGESGTNAQASNDQDRDRTDRDYAIALQLQYEEEERLRTENEHNNQLSERFIEQDTQSARQSTQASAPGSHRYNNSVGGARYDSSQAAPISPRRSSAGFSSDSLRADMNTHQRRTLSSSTSIPARGATITNNSRTGQYSTGYSAPRTVPAQQMVRPPISAPATSRTARTRPAVYRAADNDNGEEAPPTYEHAATQAPYHPPAGTSESEYVGTGAEFSRTALPPRPPGMISTPSAYSQSYRQQQAVSNRTSRECTIM